MDYPRYNLDQCRYYLNNIDHVAEEYASRIYPEYDENYHNTVAYVKSAILKFVTEDLKLLNKQS